MDNKDSNSKKTIIETINDYFDWLQSITYERKRCCGVADLGFYTPLMYFCFRGQACNEWSIVSSVLRDPYKDNDDYEHCILKKSELVLCRELLAYPTYLQKMVYLQHYGLRTRLLDVTLNPLVALYNACKGEQECDGVVIVGKCDNFDNSRRAELTAEFAFNYSGKNIESNITEFAAKNGVDCSDFTQPFFIYPAINNPRIEHQQGAFVMSPLIKIETDKSITRNKAPLDNSDIFLKRRAIIPASKKDELLLSLHLLGVNEGSLFQGTTERLHTIMQEEEWRKNHIKMIGVCEI